MSNAFDWARPNFSGFICHGKVAKSGLVTCAYMRGYRVFFLFFMVINLNKNQYFIFQFFFLQENGKIESTGNKVKNNKRVGVYLSK